MAIPANPDDWFKHLQEKEKKIDDVRTQIAQLQSRIVSIESKQEI